MIWHVCPCHGKLTILKLTHDICQVTREKVEAIERNTLRAGTLARGGTFRPAQPLVTSDGHGNPLG